MTMSDNQSQSDEVLKGQGFKGPLQTTRTLDGVVDVFSCWVGPSWIVVSSTGILLVEDDPVLFKALCLGVIDILGVGDESRRRRSIGIRNIEWRMG